LTLDILVPVPGTSVTATLVIGVIMTFVAVAVGSLQRRTR
ncbi:MAG: hypothetical protein RL205_287, partial [Actinomycetota bacterium]